MNITSTTLYFEKAKTTNFELLIVYFIIDKLFVQELDSRYV